jgi:hypothetical protein
MEKMGTGRRAGVAPRSFVIGRPLLYVAPPLPCPIQDDEIDRIVAANVSQSPLKDLAAEKDVIVTRLKQLKGGKDRPDVIGKDRDDHPHHWAFLLKEMMWMSEDFAKERKRHQTRSRKQSKSVELHFKGQEARQQRKKKDEAVALRRVASRAAREVRHFWGKLNKVIAYKQRLEAEDTRRAAMDRHLVFLVKQTEHYTSCLASQLTGENRRELLSEEVANFGSQVERAESQLMSTSGQEDRESDDDDEESNSEMQASFSDASNLLENAAGGANGSATSDNEDEWECPPEEAHLARDDETTLEEEEERAAASAGDELHGEDEIELLKRESELPVSVLMRSYMGKGGTVVGEPPGKGADQFAQPEPRPTKRQRLVSLAGHQYANGDSEVDLGQRAEDDEEEEEADFIPDLNEVDDERTLEEEERLGGGENAQDEISRLQNDAELTVEELMQRYYGAAQGIGAESHSGSDDGMEESENESMQCEEDSEAEDIPDRKEEDRLGDEEGPQLNNDLEPSAEKLLKDYFRAKSEKQAGGMDPANSEEDLQLESGEEKKGGGTNGDSANEDAMSEESEPEFMPDKDEADDERTLDEEERLGGGPNPDEEIAGLEGDAGLSVEELMRRYYSAPTGDSEGTADCEEEEEEDGEAEEAEDESASDNSSSEVESANAALKRLEEADEAARSVKVPRPYILSKFVTLREYQHIGLNWLVSLHERRLNGILADEVRFIPSCDSFVC